MPRSGRRPRRALSAATLELSSAGDPRYRDWLAEALQATSRPEADDLTHGFHSYPARLHPLAARRLLEPTLTPGQTLLDPFVGSGTTLVEGVRLGARTLGVDCSPLAVQLARFKATPWPSGRLAALRAAATGVAAQSRDRVSRRARTRSSGVEYDDPKLYQAHVFRELVGLREEIGGVPDAGLREALLLILSSIVVKVSRQRADTSKEQVDRAIGKGLPTRFFLRRAEELAVRMQQLERAAPPGTPAPDVRLGDARRLGHLAAASVDVVLTSPPYFGTYDYAEQHARRFGWLGLDASGLGAVEIGARRSLREPQTALAKWQRDLDAVMAELARVLRPGGLALIMIGDATVESRNLAGDEAPRSAARRAGLGELAAAYAVRPSYYRRARHPTRREHLLLFRKER